MDTVIEILPFFILVIHFLEKWFLSKASLFIVYTLSIIGNLLAATFNVLLFLDQAGIHKSLLLFSITSMWSMLMSIKGLIYLKRKSYYEKS